MCPIKNEHGELDEDALRDLVTVGGHVLEAGVRDFTAWKQAMKLKVGDVFNSGDYATIWRNVKADAAERTGQRQTLTTQDVFGDSLARKLGSNRRAADFMNDVVGPNGDTTIINKMIEEKELTPAEQAVVDKATEAHLKIRKPGAKGANPQLDAVQQAADAVREARREPGFKEDRSEKYKVNPDESPESHYERHYQEPPEGGEPPTYRESKTPKEREVGLKEDRSERYEVNPDESAQAHYERTYQDAPTAITDDAAFDQVMSRKLGNQEAAAKFKADIGDDVYAKMVGDGDLTDTEKDTVKDAISKNKVNRTPQPKTRNKYQSVDDLIKELRDDAAFREETSKPPVEEDPYNEREPKMQGQTSDMPSTSDLPDDVFDKKMSEQLGTKAAAEKFRNALSEETYWKLVNEGVGSLTPHESDAVTDAFTEASTRRTPREKSEFANDFSGIAKEARARLKHEADEAKFETWQTKIGYLTDQLGKQGVKGAKLSKAVKAMNSVTVDNVNHLANVFNIHSDRGFMGYRTATRYVRNALLDNPGTLGSALVGHLGSAGLEQTAIKFIANRLLGSGKVHADIDLSSLSKAISKSFNQGLHESYGLSPKELAQNTISAVRERNIKALGHGFNSNAKQWHGDAASILGRQDSLPHSNDLNPEFTVGRGGKIGNTVSTLVRQGGRMHSALWHAVSVGIDDIALQDAARYAAIDENRAQIKKGASPLTDNQVKARAHELYKNPSEKVRNDATDIREEQMFQNNSKAASLLSKVQDIPGLSSLEPFVRVGTNITARQIEFNPFGAAASVGSKFYDFAKSNDMDFNPLDVSSWKQIFDAMPAAKQAQIARITARGIVGSVPYVTGYAGYKGGYVNAPNEKRGEYGSVNVQPVKAIGYNGGKYEYGRWLTPWAAQFTLGADEARANHAGKLVPPAQDLKEAYGENPFANFDVIQNFADPAVDYTVKSGPNAGKRVQKPSGLARIAGAIERTYVPTLVAAISASADPRHVMRDTDSSNIAKYMVNILKVTTGAGRSKMPPKIISSGPLTGKPIPQAVNLNPLLPRYSPALSPGVVKAYRADDAEWSSGKRNGH